VQHLRCGIRRYNESTGTANRDTSGYHKTLTRLYVMGIQQFVREHEAASVTVPLLRELLQSELADKEWPLRFISTPDALLSRGEAGMGGARPQWAGRG